MPPTGGGAFQFNFQAAEKKVKRAKRKIAWKRFENTKPPDDYEDPGDVEAIGNAYCTMGDRNLKSESSYVVPDSYRLTIEDGAKRLKACEKQLLQMEEE